MELEADFSAAEYAYFSQQFEQKGQQSHLVPNPNTSAFFTQQIDDSTFQPFEGTFFYPDLAIAAVPTYTPSYGSPQSTFYDSSSSISDYEPSDGYSSCSSPGLASPNIQADFPIDEEQRDPLQFDEDLQQYADAYKNFELQLQQDQPFRIVTTEQEIKMENNPFGSLKLDTNVSSLDDNSHANDGSADFMNISPNTLAQCLQVDQPVFSFIPATPITPTKAQAIADSIFGLINTPQPISIDHQKQAQSGSTAASSVNPESITKSAITSNTNSPATNTANVNNKAPNSRRASSSSTSSTQSHHNRNSNTAVTAPTTTPTHHHRSHRKALPQDMAERLHTMNLAPPKPQRKSKTSAPFTCPYDDCPKTFTRQYNLKSHLRTHTDERPFLCGFQGCTRAFARQHDRKRHYNLHLGFKPHVCSHCGRAFARLDALNRHLRSDSGAPCAQATLPNGGAKKFKAVNM